MSYILYCRDAGFDCNTQVSGETAEEILVKVRGHALADHAVIVDPPMEGALRTLIRSA